jgi:hypothetical protein
MYDSSKILPGILAFVALAAFPLWYNAAVGVHPVKDPLLPAGKKECVRPAGYMRSDHMNLLVRWRDDVVREGYREPVSVAGVSYSRSLTGACMECHTSKRDFCDRCHNYAGVSPKCWDCHVAPEEKTREAE